MDSLEHVTNVISRQRAMELTFLKRDVANLRDEIEAVVIQLCKRILEYQAKAVCYLIRALPPNFLLNIVKADDWIGLLSRLMA